MNYKILPLILLISFNFLFIKCETNNKKQINSIIENIQTNLTPDKRVAVFNIKPKLENGKFILTGETNLKEAMAKLDNELKKNNFSYENEINLLPDSNLGDKHYGVINLSVGNIRSNPEHSAELATQALLGTVVNVLKENDGWYLIQTPDKYISWINTGGIQLVDENTVNEWKNEKKVIITKNYSTLFSEPSISGEIVSDLVMGDILKLIEINNGFAKVEFPDGRQGYVKNEDIMNFEKWAGDSTASSKNIIATAKLFMGLPYLWGGTSSKGVDCSGFTKTIFYMNGVILPRDASQQVKVGELVNTDSNFDNLIPGDLLFFGRKKTDAHKEKIIHVALYIGNGRYIHSSGRVRYNSLDSNAEDFNKYRYDTFIRAKRIIGYFDKGENLVKNNPFYK